MIDELKFREYIKQNGHYLVLDPIVSWVIVEESYDDKDIGDSKFYYHRPITLFGDEGSESILCDQKCSIIPALPCSYLIKLQCGIEIENELDFLYYYNGCIGNSDCRYDSLDDFIHDMDQRIQERKEKSLRL